MSLSLLSRPKPEHRPLDAVIRDLYQYPMLAGMPADTRFTWEVGRGHIAVEFFTPPHCRTAGRIDFSDITEADPHSLVERIDRSLRAIRDEHYWATFNVWPGWRT